MYIMGQFELKAGASCSWLQKKGDNLSLFFFFLKVIAVQVKDVTMTAP